MIEQSTYIIGILLFLVLDMVSVGARTAFLESSYTRLLTMREMDGERINRTILVISKLPRIRASLNLTLIVLRFLMAGFTIALVFSAFGDSFWVNLLVLFLVALVIFVFEWLVERVVLDSPELWAIRFTGFVRVMMGVMYLPLLIPMASSGDSLSESELTGTVTEDEFRTLVDAGQEEGFVEEGERRMIYSIFRLGDTLAREIMVPRIDINALEVDTTLAEAVDSFVESGHSRVPVFDETIDNTLGMLYAKDLLQVWREGGEINSLHELLRPAYFVPEAKKVDELLAEMQTQRTHIAIVVDEYGGVAGLVTLEDIVEEIFGEIQDEYDYAEESPYQELEGGEYMFLGRIDLDDFNDILGCDLPSDEADTLGGYIYSRLGRVPQPGEQIEKDGLLLTVEQVSARRIRKVRAVMSVDEDQFERKHGHVNGN